MMISVSMGMILLLMVFLLLVGHKVSSIIDDTFPDIKLIELDSNE